MNEYLLEIARQYKTPEEFKTANFTKYEICKSKGLLRKAFPNHVAQVTIYPVEVPELTPEASLYETIENLEASYRQKQQRYGHTSKIHIGTVVKKLQLILRKFKKSCVAKRHYD